MTVAEIEAKLDQLDGTRCKRLVHHSFNDDVPPKASPGCQACAEMVARWHADAPARAERQRVRQAEIAAYRKMHPAPTLGDPAAELEQEDNLR